MSLSPRTKFHIRELPQSENQCGQTSNDKWGQISNSVPRQIDSLPQDELPGISTQEATQKRLDAIKLLAPPIIADNLIAALDLASEKKAEPRVSERKWKSSPNLSSVKLEEIIDETVDKERDLRNKEEITLITIRDQTEWNDWILTYSAPIKNTSDLYKFLTEHFEAQKKRKNQAKVHLDTNRSFDWESKKIPMSNISGNHPNQDTEESQLVNTSDLCKFLTEHFEKQENRKNQAKVHLDTNRSFHWESKKIPMSNISSNHPNQDTGESQLANEFDNRVVAGTSLTEQISSAPSSSRTEQPALAVVSSEPVSNHPEKPLLPNVPVLLPKPPSRQLSQPNLENNSPQSIAPTLEEMQQLQQEEPKKSQTSRTSSLESLNLSDLFQEGSEKEGRMDQRTPTNIIGEIVNNMNPAPINLYPPDEIPIPALQNEPAVSKQEKLGKWTRCKSTFKKFWKQIIACFRRRKAY